MPHCKYLILFMHTLGSFTPKHSHCNAVVLCKARVWQLRGLAATYILPSPYLGSAQAAHCTSRKPHLLHGDAVCRDSVAGFQPQFPLASVLHVHLIAACNSLFKSFARYFNVYWTTDEIYYFMNYELLWKHTFILKYLLSCYSWLQDY